MTNFSDFSITVSGSMAFTTDDPFPDPAPLELRASFPTPGVPDGDYTDDFLKSGTEMTGFWKGSIPVKRALVENGVLKAWADYPRGVASSDEV